MRLSKNHITPISTLDWMECYYPDLVPSEDEINTNEYNLRAMIHSDFWILLINI